jgi:hypothetical protein
MKQYNILGGIDNLTEKTKMITREEYLKAVQLIFYYRNQVNKEVEELNIINPNDMVKDYISMKLINILKAVEWDYDLKVKDFKADFTIEEIKQCRGMGKKTLKELTDFCNKIDIKLK